MEKERESLIFYRSFYEAIKELNFEQQGEIYNAIFQYGLNFIEPKLKGISKTIFTLIKPQLDANIRKYKNGSLPKSKQKISKTQAKSKQKISKTQGNVNDNVNDNNKETLLQELESFIIHWNKIFKENRKVTIDLINAYKILRKKYTLKEFKIGVSGYCKEKVNEEIKFRLTPLTFLKQSNGFPKYL